MPLTAPATPPARVLVIGAGAIGGLLAARLALAGHTVAVVARGAHCAAMRAAGSILLETRGEIRQAPVTAFDSIAAAPAADFVFITLKAYQLPALATELGARARAARVCVPVQNGIPWWYFQRATGPHANRVVQAVDPAGTLAAQLRDAVLAPGFASIAAEVVAPGHIVAPAAAADAMPLGPLGPDDQAGALAAAALIATTGYLAPLVDVRQAAWAKLLGNLWTNPLGALTRSTISHLATHPVGQQLARELMIEAEAVANALGVVPGLDYEQRFERSRVLRQGIKSSMLQDIERGRQTERVAILQALVELADLAGVAVPRARTLNACLLLLEENLAAERAVEAARMPA